MTYHVFSTGNSILAYEEKICKEYCVEDDQIKLKRTHLTEGTIGDVVFAIDEDNYQILPHLLTVNTIKQFVYCDILQLDNESLNVTKHLRLESDDISSGVNIIRKKAMILLSNQLLKNVTKSDTSTTVWELDWLPIVDGCIYSKFVIIRDTALKYQLFSLTEEGVAHFQQLCNYTIPFDYVSILKGVVIHWRLLRNEYVPVFIITTSMNQILLINNESNVLYCIASNTEILNTLTLTVS